MVNADHDAQLRLLDLQATDTVLAQLAHRRRNLPEIAAIADQTVRDADLFNEQIDAETRLADVDSDQRRLEGEIDTVRARAARDEQRLQAGGVSKELEGLQHEIATLARRQTTLEDELLEVMERREEVEADLAKVRLARDELAATIAELSAKRDAAFAEIDAAIEERTDERTIRRTGVPDDLLALYEKARGHGGGIGAAILKARRCEGCHIELSGSELNSVRAAAPDAVIRCDNCRRILIRTAESGL
jgi:predicted  nucleic acid-binding Zn-ribbon protein